jgi:hypothetical protein
MMIRNLVFQSDATKTYPTLDAWFKAYYEKIPSPPSYKYDKIAGLNVIYHVDSNGNLAYNGAIQQLK